MVALCLCLTQLFGAQGPSYQPVVSLPEQEKKTGEEEEKQLFAGACMFVVHGINDYAHLQSNGCARKAAVKLECMGWHVF